MDLRKLNIKDSNYKMYASLRNNTLDFTSAKMDVLHQELLKLKGNAKSYDAFAKAAQSRTNLHLNVWLETEQRTAETQTKMALRWQDIQAQKHILPYLMYVTAGDEVVRNEHALLDGTTLPVDDPFWEKWYTPNGYNCRCDVYQVAEGRKEPKGIPKKSPKSFLSNPGMSMKAFSDNHPYFAEAENYRKVQRAMTEELDLYDVIVDDVDTGKKFTRHVQQFSQERKANTRTGKYLLRFVDKVIMPAYSFQEGSKSVDFIILGLKTEFKNPSGLRQIPTRIREANRQMAQLVILKVGVELSYSLLYSRTKGSLYKINKYIDEVWYILPSGKLHKFKRSQFK